MRLNLTTLSLLAKQENVELWRKANKINEEAASYNGFVTINDYNYSHIRRFLACHDNIDHIAPYCFSFYCIILYQYNNDLIILLICAGAVQLHVTLILIASNSFCIRSMFITVEEIVLS